MYIGSRLIAPSFRREGSATIAAATIAPSAATSVDRLDEAGGLSATGGFLYDKVLVDAECTHDGSIKHLAKFESWGWESFERRFLQPERIAMLQALQLRLLRNGFRLLRPGGALVYSTCSFARAQNELVVEALLRDELSARLLPMSALEQAPCRIGSLPHTLRFDPCTSQTSALFVARIGKVTGGGDR